MFSLIAKLLLAFYAAKRIAAFLKQRRDVSDRLPRLYSAIQPASLPGFVFPKSPFYRVMGFHWDERATLYKDAPLKTYAIAGTLAGHTTIFSANLDAFHQCLSLGSDYIKGPNPGLEMMGPNVVSTEGDDWKRHRRIAAPAFNHSTYENVWDTTMRVYEDMLDKEGWRNMDETPVTDISKATHKLALFLIANVGFGIPMAWNEPPRDERGRLTAQAMISGVATHIMDRMLVPKWAYLLGTEKLTQIEEAYTGFVDFIRERILEREEELTKIKATPGGDALSAGSIKDILGRLVNARMSEGKNSLSDEELIGNCFVFTFAGHETSANTLSVILGLLALYPDEQEWVYNSIVEVLGDREPTFNDFDKLDGVMACLYEGLRLYPAAYLLGKIASKDTTLSLSRKDNPEVKEMIPIKKGTSVTLDMVGMCYDPQSFPEPETFNPRRWKRSTKSSTAIPTALATEADEVTGSSPASTFEGFLAFSYGPRTCIGHKFAKVESVAFLTLLLRDWRVEAVMKSGESKEAWRARVLKPSFGEALLIGEVPLRLIRRK